MARGDNKLDMDFTPAINPCAFPCNQHAYITGIAESLWYVN